MIFEIGSGFGVVSRLRRAAAAEKLAEEIAETRAAALRSAASAAEIEAAEIEMNVLGRDVVAAALALRTRPGPVC